MVELANKRKQMNIFINFPQARVKTFIDEKFQSLLILPVLVNIDIQF